MGTALKDRVGRHTMTTAAPWSPLKALSLGVLALVLGSCGTQREPLLTGVIRGTWDGPSPQNPLDLTLTVTRRGFFVEGSSIRIDQQEQSFEVRLRPGPPVDIQIGSRPIGTSVMVENQVLLLEGFAVFAEAVPVGALDVHLTTASVRRETCQVKVLEPDGQNGLRTVVRLQWLGDRLTQPTNALGTAVFEDLPSRPWHVTAIPDYGSPDHEGWLRRRAWQTVATLPTGASSAQVTLVAATEFTVAWVYRAERGTPLLLYRCGVEDYPALIPLPRTPTGDVRVLLPLECQKAEFSLAVTPVDPDVAVSSIVAQATLETEAIARGRVLLASSGDR